MMLKGQKNNNTNGIKHENVFGLVKSKSNPCKCISLL